MTDYTKNFNNKMQDKQFENKLKRLTVNTTATGKKLKETTHLM